MKPIYIEEQFQEFRKLVVATKFAQIYEDSIDVIVNLSSIASLKLILWAVRRMDEDNFVNIRRAEKIEFIRDCNSGSVSTVNKALKELTDKNLLVSSNIGGQRLGRFIVNPGYFWKSNNQKDRTNRIKEYYEFLKFKANEKD